MTNLKMSCGQMNVALCSKVIKGFAGEKGVLLQNQNLERNILAKCTFGWVLAAKDTCNSYSHFWWNDECDWSYRVVQGRIDPYPKEVNNNPCPMQDNDPKHTSTRVGLWLQDTGVNWLKTPAELQNKNPIENSWHKLKEYNWCVIQPTTKDELVSGILQFWESIDMAKCKKYIYHLKKVVPKVIEKNGGPTGYWHYLLSYLSFTSFNMFSA